MVRKILTLLVWISPLSLCAQKEVTMSDLLSNTYEAQDIYIYNHTCVCQKCKKQDFICTKLDDSPFLTLSAWLKQNPNVQVSFEIYIDSRTAAKYQNNFTEQKAEELTAILLEFGVGGGQFTCKGMGASPRTLRNDEKGKNSDYLFKAGTLLNELFINNILTSVGYEEYEDAHLLNRRIEMKIISK